MQLITLLFFAIFTSFVSAQPVSYTINFNRLSANYSGLGTRAVGNTHQENGFIITGDGVGLRYNGLMFHGAANSTSNAAGLITLSQADGSLFTLESMTISPVDANNIVRPTIKIDFVGLFEDGSYKIIQFNARLSTASISWKVDFADFKNVKSVYWYQQKVVASPPVNSSHAFKNITVTYNNSVARAIFILLVFGAGILAVFVPIRLENFIDAILSRAAYRK